MVAPSEGLNRLAIGTDERMLHTARERDVHLLAKNRPHQRLEEVGNAQGRKTRVERKKFSGHPILRVEGCDLRMWPVESQRIP